MSLRLPTNYIEKLSLKNKTGQKQRRQNKTVKHCLYLCKNGAGLGGFPVQFTKASDQERLIFMTNESYRQVTVASSPGPVGRSRSGLYLP